jgi:hypothetical protein
VNKTITIIVACTTTAKQQPLNKQIYNRRYKVMVPQTRESPQERENTAITEAVFSMSPCTDKQAQLPTAVSKLVTERVRKPLGFSCCEQLMWEAGS